MIAELVGVAVGVEVDLIPGPATDAGLFVVVRFVLTADDGVVVDVSPPGSVCNFAVDGSFVVVVFKGKCVVDSAKPPLHSPVEAENKYY